MQNDTQGAVYLQTNDADKNEVVAYDRAGEGSAISTIGSSSEWRMPAVTIEDRPRFAWRDEGMSRDLRFARASQCAPRRAARGEGA